MKIKEQYKIRNIIRSIIMEESALPPLNKELVQLTSEYKSKVNNFTKYFKLYMSKFGDLYSAANTIEKIKLTTTEGKIILKFLDSFHEVVHSHHKIDSYIAQNFSSIKDTYAQIYKNSMQLKLYLLGYYAIILDQIFNLLDTTDNSTKTIFTKKLNTFLIHLRMLKVPEQGYIYNTKNYNDLKKIGKVYMKSNYMGKLFTSLKNSITLYIKIGQRK